MISYKKENQILYQKMNNIKIFFFSKSFNIYLKYYFNIDILISKINELIKLNRLFCIF